MYPAAPNSPVNDDADPAAFWFARMNSGTPPGLKDEAAFRQWLNADPANMAAYRSCHEAWRLLGDQAGEAQMLAMRARALREPGATVSRRRALFGLTGGAIAAAGAGVWVMTASSPARALIQTRAGQRLTAPLPDGSEVTLAPLTRLRLDFTGDRRAVTLEEGQAYFRILPRDARPFVVRADDAVASLAKGRFQMTTFSGRSDLVVEDGVVSVTTRNSGQPVTRVRPGQRASLSASQVHVLDGDVESETAWRLGRLVFRDRPLSEVVAVFNRYSPDRLALADARAAETRISGSFRYDGAREFLMALTTGFDLRVDRTGETSWRIRSADGTATL